ncbi:MAG TPA: hypothetical protein DCW71_06260 [Alistipes sp.]|nr:hypothetical protein [Alistipes sp.]
MQLRAPKPFFAPAGAGPLRWPECRAEGDRVLPGRENVPLPCWEPFPISRKVRRAEIGLCRGGLHP